MRLKKYRIYTLLVLLLAVSVLASGCRQTEKEENKKELLIYCGITTIKPMADIARIIEEQENCKITIIKGGSGNLLKSIKINKVGDLYLPGSDSYIKTCLQEGLVIETVHVGYNKAAMMVRKGNPKGITPNLDNLASKKYCVAICNPNSGSIGRETKRILDKRGLFSDVQNNARGMTTDSKDLVFMIKNDEADLTINWYATSTWPENEPYVDMLPIKEEYATKKKLVVGLLKTAAYPELARKFMKYAASEKGRKLFNKYGLYDMK
jgi:molybdate transport system substrate-binding protein